MATCCSAKYGSQNFNANGTSVKLLYLVEKSYTSFVRIDMLFKL